MPIIKAEVISVRTESDIVKVRQTVRQWAREHKFSLLDQTKLTTASSELARNTVKYGGGGTVRIEKWEEGIRKGLKLIFEDHGPGIPDVEAAVRDGYTTGGGLGLGLGGSRRLCGEFKIETEIGKGTRVIVASWH